MAINFFHGDCMEFMKDKPDGFYDLAVVDPPYGGGGYSFSNGESRFGGLFDKYGITPPSTSKPSKTKQINHMIGGKLFLRYGITPAGNTTRKGGVSLTTLRLVFSFGIMHHHRNTSTNYSAFPKIK